MTHGPELAKIFALMGKDALKQRITQTKQKLVGDHVTNL